MIQNELRSRGTADFPIEYYYIDKTHPRYDMSAHWHGEIEIIRVLKGKLSIKLNNSFYIGKKDDIFIVNSETVHSATPQDCVYECIVFQPDFLYNTTLSCRFFIENLLNREYIIKEYIPKNEAELYSTADEVFNSLKHKSSGHKFKVIGGLYKLLGVITDSHLYSAVNANSTDIDNHNIPKLKKILYYIRSNYQNRISLANMAETAGMSTKYFCTFFKNMTGQTPVTYLNSYRIEKAVQQLISTDDSITDIAYLCGFNDLSYFIKTFKEQKGVSPGSYRKK